MGYRLKEKREEMKRTQEALYACHTRRVSKKRLHRFD